MLIAARTFAIEAHGDQRYGDHPYVVHLEAVVSLLEPYGQDAKVIGYLHDVVEDTPITVADIDVRFGSFIAGCVGLVSDEPGANRKERKARTYARLARVSGPESLALVVKAADRLANLESCIRNGEAGLLEMYRGEQLAFRKAVYREALCDDLWERLDTL